MDDLVTSTGYIDLVTKYLPLTSKTVSGTLWE